MHRIPKTTVWLTAAYAVVWMLCLGDWLWMGQRLTIRVPSFGMTGAQFAYLYVPAIVFALGLPVSMAWILWATWPVRRGTMTIAAILTVAYVLLWQLGVFVADALAWDMMSTYLARCGTGGLFFIGLAWAVWGIERASNYFESQWKVRADVIGTPTRFSFHSVPAQLTKAYAIIWLVCLPFWLAIPNRLSQQPESTIPAWGIVVLAIWFAMGPLVSLAWFAWTFWPKRRSGIARSIVLTGAYLVFWQSFVFYADVWSWSIQHANVAWFGTVALCFIVLAWLVWAFERSAQHDSYVQRDVGPDLGSDLANLLLLALFFVPAPLYWAWRRGWPIRIGMLGVQLFALLSPLLLRFWIAQVGLTPITDVVRLLVLLLLIVLFIPALPFWALRKRRPVRIVALIALCITLNIWVPTVAFAASWLSVPAFERLYLFVLPVCVLLTGLVAWIWRSRRGVLLQQVEADYADTGLATVQHKYPWLDQGIHYRWNLLDPDAWYYGKRQKKLNQSLTGLLGYSFSFMLAFLIFSQIGGCQELYEMPAGGGEQAQIAQTVKVQKIIKKKYVVNPFSAILFKVPPIDEVKLQLNEITKHAYTVGYGKGDGAGFSEGTRRGKVRFIRLEYNGGDWNQDFGVGADLNMLIEYGIRTKHKVANKTESRTVGQLKNFPAEKSPPMVYLTGQRSISLSKNEVKVLREYVTEKHGMIFGDNGGSRHFHNQFVSMMGQVLPNVRPVPVALDDMIHRIPFQIPFLPYVAPHGGNVALGWKVDGRWLCYYHPGDIGDAWTDDHAGVPPEIYEFCYQLGTNVIFYAHSEYSKWLEARRRNR